MKTRLTIYILIILAIVMFASASHASILFSENVTGSVDLTRVDSESRSLIRRSALDTTVVDSTIKNDTYDQDYGLNWNKNLFGNINSRASVRYFKFNSQIVSEETWRSNLIPNGELVISNPDFFKLTSTFRRIIARSNLETIDRTTDQTSFLYKSLYEKLPEFDINVNLNNSINDYDANLRNIRTQLYSLSTQFEHDINRFYFSYSNRRTQNIPKQIKTYSNNQTFRWNRRSIHNNDKFKLSMGYILTRSASSNVVSDSSNTLFPSSSINTFYSIDPSPEIGTLDTLLGLSDGNFDNPTVPEIDIGSINFDRNIGIEQIFEYNTNGIYIYTDRTSGNNINWDIYYSSNNISWTKYTSSKSILFNTIENRYEISFDGLSSKFIKLVNSGVNPFDSVKVTEIQLLLNLSEDNKFKQTKVSHSADISVKYQVNDNWNIASDLSLRRQPQGAGTSASYDIFYNLKGNHQTSEALSQIIRFSSGYQTFGEVDKSLKTFTLGYTSLYDPYPTLDFIFSANNVFAYDDTALIQQNHNLFFQANGNILPDLTFSASSALGRNGQPGVNNHFDSWNSNFVVDAQLTRNATISLTYSHQIIKEKEENSLAKDQISFNLNYRVSRTIYMRSMLSYYNDIVKFFGQTYNLSWNLSSRLSLNGLYRNDERDETIRTEQLSFSSSLRVKSRALIYMSFVKNRLMEAGGANTTSYLFGFKSGF